MRNTSPDFSSRSPRTRTKVPFDELRSSSRALGPCRRTASVGRRARTAVGKRDVALFAAEHQLAAPGARRRAWCRRCRVGAAVPGRLARRRAEDAHAVLHQRRADRAPRRQRRVAQNLFADEEHVPGREAGAEDTQIHPVDRVDGTKNDLAALHHQPRVARGQVGIAGEAQAALAAADVERVAHDAHHFTVGAVAVERSTRRPRPADR